MTIDLKVSIQKDTLENRNELQLICDSISAFAGSQRKIIEEMRQSLYNNCHSEIRNEIEEKTHILVSESIALDNISEMLERTIKNASCRHDLTDITFAIGCTGPEDGGKSELELFSMALEEYAECERERGRKLLNDIKEKDFFATVQIRKDLSVILEEREAITKLFKKMRSAVKLEKEIGHLSITDSGIGNVDGIE